MSTHEQPRDNEQHDRPDMPGEATGKQRKRDDQSKYNLERDSVEDLTNEPMREEGEDEPR